MDIARKWTLPLLDYQFYDSPFSSSLAITKLDVLDNLDKIRIGAYYKLDGEPLETPPGNTVDLGRVEVEYIEMEGWRTPISKCRKFDELPPQAKKYLQQVEALVGVPRKYQSFSIDSGC